MKPRRTPKSNTVLHLASGTEDNDLWAERCNDVDGDPCIRSVWQPSDGERKLIAEGAQVYLIVWGDMHPPVAIGVRNFELGR